MSFNAFNMGCNIVALQKNNSKYGLCVAWAQMLDYDVVSVLIGESSVTASVLEIGDIVGISSLSSDQKEIALNFGEHHSDVYDKFKNLSYRTENQAILIENAKVTMKCKIIDIQHFSFSPRDSFVILKVLSSQENHQLIFLSLSDI